MEGCRPDKRLDLMPKEGLIKFVVGSFVVNMIPRIKAWGSVFIYAVFPNSNFIDVEVG